MENETLDLIRDVGVHRLGLFDGCVCCHFSVRGVDVAISCGKGEKRGVRVSSGSSDYMNEDYSPDTSVLQPIADEVARQVFEIDGFNRGQIPAIVERSS